jgi:hypothetical protein
VIRSDQVPDLKLFGNNTAAFVHDLPAESIANVAGDSSYMRVQVLTPVAVVKALVHVDAFAPAKGESALGLDSSKWPR